MGAEGAVLVTEGLVVEAAAPAVEVVDGSGAGDAFAAGLIVGVLEGWSMAQSVRFASVVGASACTQLGCLAGVFTREQAESYLAAHPLETRVHERGAASPAGGGS
jgi:sugar/nucleoside kinase (ribokinase family)